MQRGLARSCNDELLQAGLSQTNRSRLGRGSWGTQRLGVLTAHTQTSSSCLVMWHLP